MMLLLTGCDGGPLSFQDQFELLEADQIWRRVGPTNYTYQIRQICFCPVEMTRFVRVEVRMDSVVAATDVETNTPMPPDKLGFWPTINELFRGLHRLRASEAIESVAVRYDPELGYPRYINTQPRKDVADAGGTVETRALIPLQ